MKGIKEKILKRNSWPNHRKKAKNKFFIYIYI